MTSAGSGHLLGLATNAAVAAERGGLLAVIKANLTRGGLRAGRRFCDAARAGDQWQRLQGLGQRRHHCVEPAGGLGCAGGLLGQDRDDPAVGHISEARAAVELRGGPVGRAAGGTEKSSRCP